MTMPLTVTYMAEKAAIAALNSAEELLARVKETKVQRERVAAAIGARPSKGNFVWIPRGDAEEVERKLSDEGVIIRRYLDEGVRVSITTEEETNIFLAAWERAGIEPWRG